MEISEKLLVDTFEKHLWQPDGTEKRTPKPKKMRTRLLKIQHPEVDPEIFKEASEYL